MQRVNESSQRNTVKKKPSPSPKTKITSYFDTWHAYVQSTFEQQRPHPSCHDCFENRFVWAKCAVHNQLDAICATMCTQRPVRRSACNYRPCPIQRDEKQSSVMCCPSMFNQTSCNENCIPGSPVAAKSYLSNFFCTNCNNQAFMPNLRDIGMLPHTIAQPNCPRAGWSVLTTDCLPKFSWEAIMSKNPLVFSTIWPQ